MRVKLSIFAMIVVFATTLIGCSYSNRIPAPELPTYFTRTSDGARIALGMHRNEIENILERSEFYYDMIRKDMEAGRSGNLGGYDGIVGATIVRYNDDDMVYEIATSAFEWTINGFSAEDNVQTIVGSNKFPRIFPSSDRSSFLSLNDPYNVEFGLQINHDEDGNIYFMRLFTDPDLSRFGR